MVQVLVESDAIEVQVDPTAEGGKATALEARLRAFQQHGFDVQRHQLDGGRWLLRLVGSPGNASADLSLTEAPHAVWPGPMPKVPSTIQNRLNELAQKNKSGALAQHEQAELDELLTYLDDLTIRELSRRVAQQPANERLEQR